MNIAFTLISTHAMRSRRLLLIDVENLLGTADPRAGQAQRCLNEVFRLVSPRQGDHLVIGASHHAIETCGWEWPREARRVVRSGPDGADLALLDVLEERIGERFGAVVIASGDGIFTEASAALAASGVDVTVVARPGCLSRRLRLAAGRVRFLSPLTGPAEGVVA